MVNTLTKGPDENGEQVGISTTSPQEGQRELTSLEQQHIKGVKELVATQCQRIEQKLPEHYSGESEISYRWYVHLSNQFMQLGTESLLHTLPSDSFLSTIGQKINKENIAKLTEDAREEVIRSFFEHIRTGYPKFYDDFVGNDDKLLEKTFWERVSVMLDRKKEERVRERLR